MNNPIFILSVGKTYARVTASAPFLNSPASVLGEGSFYLDAFTIL